LIFQELLVVYLLAADTVCDEEFLKTAGYKAASFGFSES
jgi:hypothetical protein